jgi:hypothetical protein
MRFIRLGWLAITAAFLLRVSTYVHTKIGLSGDAYSYLDKAREFAGTGKLPKLSPQPSGYPLVISHLLQGDNDLSAISIARTQQVMDLSLVFALIIISWQLLRGKSEAVRPLVAAVLLLQPFTATMSSQIYTEQMVSFFSFFGVLALAMGLACRGRLLKLLLIASGSSLMGLAAIMRSDILLLNATILLLATMLGIWKLQLRNPSVIATLLLPFLLAPTFTLLIQYTSTRELGFANSQFHHAGYYSWLRTWPADRKEYADHAFLDSSVPAIPFSGSRVDAYSDKAFATQEERRTVTKLLNDWRREGYGKSVDQGFQQLAEEKQKQHPFHYFLLNPIYRMSHFWVNIDGAQFYLMSHPLKKPWSLMIVGATTLMRAVLIGLFLYGLSLCPGLLMSLKPPTNPFSQSLFIGILHCLSAAYVVLRTLELGLLGLISWGGLMEVRYVMVAIPFALVVCISSLSILLSHEVPLLASSRPQAMTSRNEI